MLFKITRNIHRGPKIELNCELFSAIIFYNFQRELSQLQCTNKLISILAASRSSVFRWYGESNRGRISLKDEFREGCSENYRYCAQTDIANKVELRIGI